MADTFPTTLADLNFRDASTVVSRPSLYHSLKDLRKATLSIPNRLASILQDAQFVERIVTECSALPRSPLTGDHGYDGSVAPLMPLIANERCGSWYIPPERKAGSAYFKSTDGHFGQWGFSLRRLNLHVLGVVGRGGGAVIVDSTRRGKSMPDAFAKTVPIWVAVMNRVLFPDLPGSHGLQGPPPGSCGGSLGGSEIAQIEGRLDGFVRAVEGLGLDVGRLREEAGRPVELFWRVNDGFTAMVNGGMGYDLRSERSTAGTRHPVILCSASRRVLGAEMSEGTYIQGAGDDSEGWSRGLTPVLFWQHKDQLLNTPESELESLIQTLLVDAQKEDGQAMAAVRLAPTSNLYIAKAVVGGADMPRPVEQDARTLSGHAQIKEALGHETETKFDLVINCSTADVSIPAARRLDLTCRTGKLGSRDLRGKLGLVRDSVQVLLRSSHAASLLVTCETGKDLCVGVALMILCLFYDNQGHVVLHPDQHTACSKNGASNLHVKSPSMEILDKSFIRRRLAWIVSSYPDASPSRTTLQAINGFLMDRPA